MPTVTSYQGEAEAQLIDGSNDLLSVARAFAHAQSVRLWWEAGIAAVTAGAACALVLAWHRRVRGPYRTGWQPLLIFAGLLVLVFGAEILIARVTDPVVPRERFTFIDVPSQRSFATLAIFTEIPDRINQDENGIFRVYARAYLSKKTTAITDVRIWVDSPRLNVSRVSRRQLSNSTYGKTRGAEFAYEYRADKLGRHALREHFDIAVRRDAKPGTDTYSTDVVEYVDVVAPVSLYELITNDSILKIAGFVGPLILAAFGLSKLSTKDEARPKKETS